MHKKPKILFTEDGKSGKRENIGLTIGFYFPGHFNVQTVAAI